MGEGEVFALLLVCVSGITTIKMFLNYRIKMHAGSKEDVSEYLENIQNSIDELRSDLSENQNYVNNRLDEVSDRIDFAERLLAKSSKDLES